MHKKYISACFQQIFTFSVRRTPKKVFAWVLDILCYNKRQKKFTVGNLKDIREIDTNMKELVKNLEVKWFKVDSKVIDNYMLGKGLKNGTFNRLDDSFVSDHVETLKKHTAGYSLEFRTASRFIKIQAKLAGPAYMAHMTAVGTIGFSLYVKKGKKWYFVSSSKINQAEYELDLIKDINKKPYTYRLYFPLYQALLDLKIGVEYDAPFEFVQDEMETILVWHINFEATPPIQHGLLFDSRPAEKPEYHQLGQAATSSNQRCHHQSNHPGRKVKYLLFSGSKFLPITFPGRFTYFMEH